MWVWSLEFCLAHNCNIWTLSKYALSRTLKFPGFYRPLNITLMDNNVGGTIGTIYGSLPYMQNPSGVGCSYKKNNNSVIVLYKRAELERMSCYMLHVWKRTKNFEVFSGVGSNIWLRVVPVTSESYLRHRCSLWHYKWLISRIVGLSTHSLKSAASKKRISGLDFSEHRDTYYWKKTLVKWVIHNKVPLKIQVLIWIQDALEVTNILKDTALGFPWGQFSGRVLLSPVSKLPEFIFAFHHQIIDWPFLAKDNCWCGRVKETKQCITPD